MFFFLYFIYSQNSFNATLHRRWFNKQTRAHWGLTVPLGVAVFSIYVSLDYFWYAQSKETGRKHCAAKLEDMRDEDVLEDGGCLRRLISLLSAGSFSTFFHALSPPP